ncbi:MAG: hypothetical protein WB711_07645 [Terriglobales bacterium]
MKLRLLILCTVCASLTCTAFADTLNLTNGQVITGTFLGRSSAGVQFVGPDGTSRIYPPDEVQSLTFGPVPAPVQPAAAPARQVTVPAGTILLVRMVDGLDTKTAYTGQLFTATLSTNLAANGYVVAPDGTTVYGQVVEAKSAGRVAGASQLKLQLTQIIIGGNAIPIITDVFDSQKGKSSTRRSLFRTLGGAGLGAAIGAIAGNAGMGAAIGGVAGGVGSVVQRGDQIEIPSEAQLEFHLTQPVILPIAQ